MSATAEENARLATDYFAAAMNENRFDETALSDDYVAHMGSHGTAMLDDIKATIGMMHRAFDDLVVDLEDVIATEEDVVIRWRLTGTHAGPFFGVEPTGAAVDVLGFIQFEIADGRITEAWNLSDRFAMFDQLGVIDAPTP